MLELAAENAWWFGTVEEQRQRLREEQRSVMTVLQGLQDDPSAAADYLLERHEAARRPVWWPSAPRATVSLAQYGQAELIYRLYARIQSRAEEPE